MPRVIWKGAISFGLVHVPVSLYPASQESGVDFDWLDKRSMDPVGYKRINKRTGKEVKQEDIVKGVKIEGGDYVVLGDDEIRQAFPKSTQTIDIESFVKATEIPFILLERPYYLEPAAKADRVYALLRDAMSAAAVIGIARVVMHNKEHLAALVPSGSALVLNTIRWASEIRPVGELNLPASGKKDGSRPGEMKMATQLIDEMTAAWEPESYKDSFADSIGALVKRKRDAGKTEQVTPLEDAPDSGASSNVVDLTELLSRSLRSRKAPAKQIRTKAKPARAAARKSGARPARSTTRSMTR